VQVWNMQTGANFTSIEPNRGDINDVCVWPHSGLLATATDSKHIGVYFSPALGPAPPWCGTAGVVN
jgi:ribosome biogenesis protein ENP2